MRVSIVGWEGSHPQHEQALRDALGEDTVFLSPDATRKDFTQSVPIGEGRKLLVDQAQFYILDGATPEATKLAKVLERKGAEIVPGSYEVPDWGVEPTEEVVSGWLQLGKWLEPEPEVSLEDELFGDELFGDDDEDDLLGEAHDVDEMFEEASDPDVDDPDIDDDEDEFVDSPLNSLASLSSPGWDDEPEDDDAGDFVEPEPSAPESVKRTPRPRKEAVDRANDIYRGQLDSDDNDGMTRVSRHDDADSFENADINIEFIDRDGDISGVDGGVRKTEPRESSGKAGSLREVREMPEEGDDEGDDGYFDSLSPSPVVDLTEENLTLPEDDVDYEELSGGYSEDISLSDIRDDTDEDVERQRRYNALREQRTTDVKNLGNPELYKTARNDKAASIDHMDMDDGSLDYATVSERREAEGRTAPYIDALKTSGERNAQRAVEDTGGIMRATAYASNSSVDPHSKLIAVVGTSGGVGKTLVSYTLASTAAQGLSFLQEKRATNDFKPVYLVECDWQNPDLEGLLGREYDADGKMRINDRVNTIRPIIDMYNDNPAGVKKSDVLDMIDSCTTRDPKTGLRILPAPYDLADANDNRKSLLLAIQNIVDVLLSMPGGAYVFLDCPNLEAPRSSPLTRTFLTNYNAEVVLVTKPFNTNEASRAYLTLKSDSSGQVKGEYGGRRKRVMGYGVDFENIKTILNYVPRDADMDEIREQYASHTAHMPNAYIPELTSLNRREWVGDMGSGGVSSQQRQREIHDLKVLRTRALQFLSNTFVKDLGAILKTGARGEAPVQQTGFLASLKRKLGFQL